MCKKLELNANQVLRNVLFVFMFVYIFKYTVFTIYLDLMTETFQMSSLIYANVYILIFKVVHIIILSNAQCSKEFLNIKHKIFKMHLFFCFFWYIGYADYGIYLGIYIF